MTTKARRKRKQPEPSPAMAAALNRIREAESSLVPALMDYTVATLEVAGHKGLTWSEWRASCRELTLLDAHVNMAMVSALKTGVCKQVWNRAKGNTTYVLSSTKTQRPKKSRSLVRSRA